MNRTPATAVQRVLDVLGQQREWLLSGQIGSLEADGARLEVALEDLATGTLQRDDLEFLRAAAERNSRLLGEAARGVRSVRRRMEELADDRLTETYAADGRRIAMSSMRRHGSD